jgi:Cu-processing system permease protein
MELTQILTVAAKEFRDRMRNRWVLAVALVFTVFSLVIAYFGGAQQGRWAFAPSSSPSPAWSAW